MDTNDKSPIFVRHTEVDRDDAVAFLKKVGFVETETAGTFARDSSRKTAQRVAGARYLTSVNVEALIAAPKAWRQFVLRWSKKMAA